MDFEQWCICSIRDISKIKEEAIYKAHRESLKEIFS